MEEFVVLKAIDFISKTFDDLLSDFDMKSTLSVKAYLFEQDF